MYVPIVLLVFAAVLVAGHQFLSWLLVDAEEGQGEDRHRPPRSFYNPRTWAAFRRLIRKRPALLTYRRDRFGRFRKLTPGIGGPAKRGRKPRKGRSSRPPTTRRRVQVPAE